MKKVRECQPFPEIPSALLWEILGRVPIRACLTCKLVCKEWYHIIVAPKFSSFRRQCNASHSSVLFWGRGGGGGLVFKFFKVDKALHVDDSSKCIVGVKDLIGFEPKIDPHCKLYLRSLCNGVVCLLTNKNGDYFVCKLLTGQCLKLQNVHPPRKQPAEISGSALGYCPVSGQFKILIMFWDVEKHVDLAKIQTLGNTEWRIVGNAPFETRKDGYFLNGSSHWCGESFDNDSGILSFHFEKEMFSYIPFPEEAISEGNKVLSIFNSCLCLNCYSESSAEIHIWIMKEYGVKESWVRQFIVVNAKWSAPLVHMDNGKILVRNRYMLYLYDLQTQVSKKVKLRLNGLSAKLGVAFDSSFSRF